MLPESSVFMALLVVSSFLDAMFNDILQYIHYFHFFFIIGHSVIQFSELEAETKLLLFSVCPLNLIFLSHHHLIAMWSLESYLIALRFSFPIYTMEIIKVPTHEAVIRMS